MRPPKPLELFRSLHDNNDSVTVAAESAGRNVIHPFPGSWNKDRIGVRKLQHRGRDSNQSRTDFSSVQEAKLPLFVSAIARDCRHLTNQVFQSPDVQNPKNRTLKAHTHESSCVSHRKKEKAPANGTRKHHPCRDTMVQISHRILKTSFSHVFEGDKIWYRECRISDPDTNAARTRPLAMPPLVRLGKSRPGIHDRRQATPAHPFPPLFLLLVLSSY